MYVCVCDATCMWVPRGQKTAWDALELELQIAMNHLMWVLRTELRSSVRTKILLITEPSLQLHRMFLCHSLLKCIFQKELQELQV